MTIMPVREQGAGDAAVIEEQYPDLNADPDSGGHMPREGTGIPFTVP